MTQYNSFRSELDLLNSELAEKAEEMNRIRLDIERYDAFDLDHVMSQADAVTAALPDRISRLDAARERLEATNAAIKRLRTNSSLGFNPLYWFSDQRKGLVRQLEATTKSKTEIEQAHKEAKASFERANAKGAEIKRAVEWYRAFDRDCSQQQLFQGEQRIDQLSRRIPALELECAALDAKLTPILADLRGAEYRANEARGLKVAAESYERRLQDAPNSYERRMIHEECRSRLGSDRPSQLISRARREMEAAERDIEKLKRSATQLASRMSRRVSVIVFDGNNMCYGRSNEFIGLGPLKAVARVLASEPKKIIVFDASIRRHGFSEQSIAAEIGCDVKIHIVNGAADETILDLASAGDEYVVSNDKFVDYRSKSAVTNQRVFRHELVDNMIMIHDLGVSTTYK